MKHGTKSKLAKVVEMASQTIHCLLATNERHRRHASYTMAKRLAEATGTSPELWQRGGTGTPESRQGAVMHWAEKNKL